MIDQRTVFEIHRLSNEGLSIRKIASKINLNRKTVIRYLNDPNPKTPLIERPSKLDPYKEEISEMLEIDPKVSAVVIMQRIAPLGFNGEITHSLLRWSGRSKPEISKTQPAPPVSRRCWHA